MPKTDWVVPAGRVNKPWGWESHFALVEGRYCGKVLHVEKGHALSLQYHQVKEETISIQSGRLLFEVGTRGSPLEQFELGPGESVHIVPARSIG
jgi:mannose-6-phosphate isomerase-like protein (cupin superfamily)